MRIIPQRMDVLTRKIHPKQSLLRVVLSPAPRIDYAQDQLGRAIYFAPDLASFELALKKGRLRRYGLSEETIAEIRQWIKNTDSSAC